MVENTIHRSSMLSLILCLYILVTESQASAVQTVVGSDANFSFLLNEDPGSSIVRIKDNNGVLVMYARGNRSASSNPMYSDRVDFTGNTNQKLMSFILRNVTLVDAGTYNAVIAVFTNPERTIGSQMLIVKASPSKPLIIELNGPAVTGSDYHLNCSALSNSEPFNHNLSMFSEWRKDNQTITPTGRYIVNQTELIITGIHYIQDKMVRLICDAFEDQRAKSEHSDEFVIDVKYGPVNIQVSPSNVVIAERENRQIIVNCTADCNPPCSFQWRKELVPALLSNNQTLIINNASKDDTGRYQCFISNNITGISQTAQITLIIAYGPSGAQIMFSPSELPLNVEENATVNIYCSADCYPVCNFTWSGPRGFFQMGSQLSQIVERDNDGNYTCTATNQVNLGKTATVSATIVVLYGPGSSVNLGSIPSTIGVDLNQTGPDITCSATCNPPCDYRWYQNGIFYRNGATLSLGVVEKTTRGNYRCEAYNSVLGVNRSSSTSVNITVYYPPEVLLKPAILPRPSVYILNLGQTNVGLTCVVIDASPPAQQFIWTKDGQEIKIQTSPTFTISIVTKDTMGKWGCKGVNSKGNPLESILDVDVHYGPIITNLPNITKVEGDSITVTCVVDSRPDPSSISWTKFHNNTFTQKKSEMYIAYLNRADKGIYECNVVNTIQPTGESVGERITVKSSYTLDVTYAPEISVKIIPPIAEVNSEVHIECLAHGEPPDYKFYNWTHKIGNMELRHVRGFQVNKSASVACFPSITIADMGTYICSVENGIAGPDGGIVQSKEAQIDVVGVPVAFIRDTVFIGETNMSANIQVPFFSNPLITTVKFFKTWNNALIANDTDTQVYFTEANIFTVFYNTNVILQGMAAVLNFRSLKESDFGQYTLVLYNNKGTATLSIHLQALAPPSAVEQFYFYKLVGHYMEFFFLPGFNGGHQQTFTIQFKPSGSLDDSWKNTSINGLSEMDGRYRHPNGTFLVPVETLQPGRYVFRMFSVNKKNIRMYSQEVSVYIQEEPHADLDVRPSIAGIAGGIGGGVVAILITGVVIFLWRRHSHANKAASDTACIPTAVDYEALQATRNERSLYQELSDIKSCADTKNSFRRNGTNTPEIQPANAKETSCSTQDQDYFTKGENKIYENTRVQT